MGRPAHNKPRLCHWLPLLAAASLVDAQELPLTHINPERGFYIHTSRHSDDLEPLAVDNLLDLRTAGQVALILRLFYLESFVDSAISESYLAAVDADFDAIRDAGLKAIVRFAYTDERPSAPPWGDATPSRVAEHIGQLAPLLQQHADVILVLQAGFIGVWGEWYYTDHFVTDPSRPSDVTDADMALRRSMLDQLLDAVPPSVPVAVRTPRYKQGMFDRGTPLDSVEAHTDASVSRVAHHNDCFLASSSDYGTYIDPDHEYPYLSQETRYTVMGGETCTVSSRTDCDTALTELAYFHWTYLNDGYHPDVLDQWTTEGCITDVAERLGYRLEAVDISTDDTIAPGSLLNVTITMRNSGFAAPARPRPVALLLIAENGETTGAVVPADPRDWLPGNHELAWSLEVPDCQPAGSYQLALHLPDGSPGLTRRPEYAIALAGGATWDADRGINILPVEVRVAEPPGGSDRTGGSDVADCNRLLQDGFERWPPAR